jgi:WD40 repeat protein
VAAAGQFVSAATISPDGTRLAASVNGVLLEANGLYLYQIKTGEAVGVTPLVRVEPPHRIATFALQFSPDGRALASGGADGKLKLWDLPGSGEEWKARATVGGPDMGIHAIAFRPDGRVLAFGTGDRRKPNVWLVEVPTGKVLRSFRAGGEKAQITAVAFSPDGKALATGSFSGLLEVWDADVLMRGE